MAEEKQKVSGCSYVLYYLVLFFAYWFGSNRFDVDGDGDFDPEDVQAYLADKGFLKKNFKQSVTGRQRAKRAKAKAEKDAAKKAAARGQADEQQITSSWDRNQDGQVSMEEVFGAEVTGEAQEDIAMQNLIEKQRIPWFITVQCCLCFFLWLIFAIKEAAETGADPLNLLAGIHSISKGNMNLQWAGPNCEDYRHQVWRWLTYQWSHVGAMHVLQNVFLCVICGIPLEGCHGTKRMVVMFNVGILGGAFCYYLIDAHTIVVGCSGGCYALMGIMVADLVMNWNQKKFRIPTLIFLFVLASVDIFAYTMAMTAENVSHAAHLGGAITGVIVGVMLVKNLKSLLYERVLKVLLTIVGLGLMVFSLVWIFTAENGPVNLAEAASGMNGWCWVRQVYLPDIDENGWKCVRCGTTGCIDVWNQQQYINPVSSLVCQAKGWYYDGR